MSADPAAPMTAAAASRALAACRISAAALVEQSLARVAAHDKRLNSFVLVLEERARRAARAADRALKAGRRRGPLHGIPFALKDIYETAGIRTTAHSGLLLDHVPKHDFDRGAKARRCRRHSHRQAGDP